MNAIQDVMGSAPFIVAVLAVAAVIFVVTNVRNRAKMKARKDDLDG